MSEINGTLISVESTTEWSINNIEYDGQERYLQPLLFSDHVARLLHKIDWQKLCAEDILDGIEAQSVSSIAVAKPFLPEDATVSSVATKRRKFGGDWNSVSRELQQALVELEVLGDVLQIASTRNYMMFDPVMNDLLETQKAQRVFAKKKALVYAGQQLSELTKALNPNTEATSICGYLSELRALRKIYRLKKAGNVIVGDLSLTPMGSKFRPSTTFEVYNNASQPTGLSSGKKLSLRSSIIDALSALRIVLPKDLASPMHIAIYLRQGDLILHEHCCVPITPNRARKWESILATAQRTLLSKELFQLLSREAAQSSEHSCVIRSSEIVVNLKFEAVLKIALEEISEQEKVADDGNLSSSYFSSLALEHSLERRYVSDLLRRPIPSLPVAGPLVLSSLLRHAGPNGTFVSDLTTTSVSPASLLSQVIRWSNHIVTVKRVQEVIDCFMSQAGDEIVVSYNWIHSPVLPLSNTDVMVQISSSIFDHQRVSFLISIVDDEVNVLSRDGETIQCDTEQLKRYILLQAANHQISIILHMCKVMGWNIIATMPQMLNNSSFPNPTLTASNPNTNGLLFVQYCIEGGPVVKVQLNDKGDLKTINADYLFGIGFLQQMEFLMAALS